MARKAKKGDGKAVFSRLNRVWTDIQQIDWLAWLAEVKPESMFQMAGPHIKGRCPFHDDSTASFVVTPYKGYVRCFGCGKSFWNPIYFIAAINGTSVSDALTFSKKRWGLSGAIPKDLFEKVREHEVYQRNKTTLMDYFADRLFQALEAYGRGATDTEHLGWTRRTVEYLLDRRLGESAPREIVAESEQPNGSFDQYGVWVALTSRRLLGIVPPLVDVENHFGASSEEYKFFRTYFAKYIDGQTYVGHLVLPYDDTPTSICRFKLREPAKPCVSQAWVEDNYEAEMEGFRGFYGLRYYRTYLGMQEHGLDGPDKGFSATLVEGEFDVLCAIAQQIRRSSDDYIALGLSGGGAQSADRLTTFGIQRAWILPDRDQGGIKFAKQVIEESKSKQLSFRVFRWPDVYVDWHDPTRPDARIKDCDDAIRELGYPLWVRHAAYADSYAPLDEWCYDQASLEISRVHNVDVQAISRISKSWGALIRDEQVCSAYCTAIARDHGIDAVILRRDILVREDNEEEFIKRLHMTVLEKYHPVGIENGEGRKRVLSMWSRQSKTIDKVVLNDERAAETLIARHYGTIYDFVSTTVGDPPFMVGDDEESTFNVTLRAKKYREYLNYALLKISQGLPSLDSATVRSQGVHMMDASLEHMRSYMVNGKDVYVLTHDSAAFGAVALEGPRHENTIFDNAGEKWINSVERAEDLLAGTDVDIVKLFLDTRSIINTGWSFKHQDLDTIYLASCVMSQSIATVFPRQSCVMITAEHESGKSRFTAGLIGGTGFPRINLVAHATAKQGYTAASIRQSHNNSSIALSLEEFEDYGTNDSKSVNTRKVLELFRDNNTESFVQWSVGTTSGESKTYSLRCNVFASAIRPFRDAASLSRFMQFDLVKDTSRIDPVLSITGKYGDEMIKKTRHDLVVGMLPHMLRIRRLIRETEQEYASGSNLPSYASSRFREQLVSIIAVLKLLKLEAEKRGYPAETIPDYKKFAYDFVETRRDHLARLKSTSENEKIFETILGASIQTASVGDKDQMSGVTTMRAMLGDLNKLDDVNKTRKGVYLDIQMEWLVVNWVEAAQGVLSMTRYRTETPTYLRQISERSPYHVPPEDVKRARVLERLVHIMGPCQPIDLITAFSVKHLLDFARARRAEINAKPLSPVPALRPNVDQAQTTENGDIVV